MNENLRLVGDAPFMATVWGAKGKKVLVRQLVGAELFTIQHEVLAEGRGDVLYRVRPNGRARSWKRTGRIERSFKYGLREHLRVEADGPYSPVTVVGTGARVCVEV